MIYIVTYEVHFRTSGIVYLLGIPVKFVYVGHWVKNKVTGAEKGRKSSRNLHFHGRIMVPPGPEARKRLP